MQKTCISEVTELNKKFLCHLMMHIMDCLSSSVCILKVFAHVYTYMDMNLFVYCKKYLYYVYSFDH